MHAKGPHQAGDEVGWSYEGGVIALGTTFMSLSKVNDG